MTVPQTAVFIASRFEEFADIRPLLVRKLHAAKEVQFTAIDLDDRNASHRSPLDECLRYVRRSEFMILLIGDSYGDSAPDEEKSFTHLEYDEAVRPGAATRVLVFCRGTSYQNERIEYSTDPRLANWQRELDRKHKLKFFEPSEAPDQIASEILVQFLVALHGLRRGEMEFEDANDVKDLEDATLDDEPASSRDAELRGVPPLVDASGQSSDPLKPSAADAREQREDADRAIRLCEYGVAIMHLKRAWKLKPLDLTVNYWLARLHVDLGHKDKSADVLRLIDRAVNVAKAESTGETTAACYVLRARACELAGRHEEAIADAERAVAADEYFSSRHLQLARHLLQAKEYDRAIAAIKRAYELYSGTFRIVLNDPAFHAFRPRIEALIQAIKHDVRKRLLSLLNAETELGIAATDDADDDLGELSLKRLVEACRASILRQHARVCGLIAEATSARRDSHGKEHQTGSARSTGHSKIPRKVRVTAWDKLRRELDEAEQASAVENYDGAFFLLVCASSLFALMWTYLRPEPAWNALPLGMLSVAALWIWLAKRTTARRLREVKTIRSSMQRLIDAARASELAARSAMDRFEDSSLNQTARLLPFRPLRKAVAVGAIVRARVSDLASYEKERKFARRVEIVDDLPSFIEADGLGDRTRLYRVQAVETARIVLSRAGAYAQAKASSPLGWLE